LHGRELERLRYVALLYDVGLGEGEGEEDAHRSDAPEASRISSRVVSGISFLADVVPVLELCESGEAHGVGKDALVSAYVVMATSSWLEGTTPCSQQRKVAAALGRATVTHIDGCVSRLSGLCDEDNTTLPAG
jgi:hypothetical protein